MTGKERATGQSVPARNSKNKSGARASGEARRENRRAETTNDAGIRRPTALASRALRDLEAGTGTPTGMANWFRLNSCRAGARVEQVHQRSTLWRSPQEHAPTARRRVLGASGAGDVTCWSPSGTSRPAIGGWVVLRLRAVCRSPPGHLQAPGSQTTRRQEACTPYRARAAAPFHAVVETVPVPVKM